LEALVKLWELIFGYLPSQTLSSSACLHCKQQHGFTRSIHMHWREDIDVSSADQRKM